MNTGIAISMGEAINAALVLGVLALLLWRH
jgi:hypothetical protein